MKDACSDPKGDTPQWENYDFVTQVCGTDIFWGEFIHLKITFCRQLSTPVFTVQRGAGIHWYSLALTCTWRSFVLQGPEGFVV